MKYLQDWENEAIAANPDSPAEAAKMMLSHETLEGIKITGKACATPCQSTSDIHTQWN